jgi:hypothetical protein
MRADEQEPSLILELCHGIRNDIRALSHCIVLSPGPSPRLFVFASGCLSVTVVQNLLIQLSDMIEWLDGPLR